MLLVQSRLRDVDVSTTKKCFVLVNLYESMLYFRNCKLIDSSPWLFIIVSSPYRKVKQLSTTVLIMDVQIW